jgi:N-acetylmuramoyl-L-alanine amidase
MLDAGHGGRDPGAVYNNRQEKDDTLKLVFAIGQILQNNGIDVQYTRTTDIYESPLEKAMKANEAGVDLFISIHRNSFPTDNVVSGVETLVHNLSGFKVQMAEEIDEQLEAIGFVNLGVKERPNLAVLRRTTMPALLVEVGFINSNTDNNLFDANFSEIAQAIASGILDSLEMNHLILPPGYKVQVGVFRNSTNANRIVNELLEEGFPATVISRGGFYWVEVGDYTTLDDAIAMEQRLKRAGYQTLIVTK